MRRAPFVRPDRSPRRASGSRRHAPGQPHPPLPSAPRQSRGSDRWSPTSANRAGSHIPTILTRSARVEARETVAGQPRLIDQQCRGPPLVVRHRQFEVESARAQDRAQRPTRGHRTQQIVKTGSALSTTMRDSEHSVSAPAMTSLVPRGFAVDTTITQRSTAASPAGGSITWSSKCSR